MKLENIVANFLGDSITKGAAASCPENVFHQLIAKKYNMKEARNYGLGGSRIAEQLPDVNGDLGEYASFSERMWSMEDDADLVVLFGGTNDYGHGNAPLGSMSDREPVTFYGACHYVMRGLIEKYPEARIVVITPMHREGEDDVRGEHGKKPQDVAPLSRYVEIIREVAEYYSLPIIDLWANLGLQPNVPIIKEKYCRDGLHPNDAGHKRIAEYVGKCLEAL